MKFDILCESKVHIFLADALCKYTRTSDSSNKRKYCTVCLRSLVYISTVSRYLRMDKTSLTLFSIKKMQLLDRHQIKSKIMCIRTNLLSIQNVQIWQLGHTEKFCLAIVDFQIILFNPNCIRVKYSVVVWGGAK